MRAFIIVVLLYLAYSHKDKITNALQNDSTLSKVIIHKSTDTYHPVNENLEDDGEDMAITLERDRHGNWVEP